MASADLEISLYRQNGGELVADVFFTTGETQATLAMCRPVALDQAALLAAIGVPEAYGRLLGKTLFADQLLRSAWDKACSYAHGAESDLRLRLTIRADDLHALRWETLRDPATDAPLARSAQFLLSRYLVSDDLTPVRVGPRGELRALVAAANPSDLKSRYGMSPVDAHGELRRAASALASLPVVTLGGPSGPRATRSALLEELQKGCDILYLACHGGLRGAESYLWLEGDDGTCERVAGGDLVLSIAGLRRRPLLVVLSVCGSASDTQGGSALVALGTQLALAGVPAVIAMQGNAPMSLVEQLMPALFRRLLAHGQIDRALVEARQQLKSDQPWWMPALMLRVADGRLWRDDVTPIETKPPVSALAPALRQRLERRRDDLNGELELCGRKLSHLRRARAVEAGAAQQFQLDALIAAERDAITTLEDELAQIERELGPA